MGISTNPAGRVESGRLCESQPMLEPQSSPYREDSGQATKFKFPTDFPQLFSSSPSYSDDVESTQPSQTASKNTYKGTNITGRNPFPRASCFHFLSRAMVYVLAIWGCWSLISHGLQILNSARQISCNCGNSTAEALYRGCRYDLLAGGWLRRECIDEELSDEFDRAGPGPNGAWGYYADPKGTILLNVTEISTYADDPHARYWTTFEWHLAHCIFVWRKQFRSQFTGRKVEARHDTEGHIIHCGKMFLKERPVGLGIVTHNGAALNTDLSEVEEAKYRGLSLAKVRPGLEALQKEKQE